MGKIKILLVLTVVCSLMFGNVAMATEATTSGSSLVETVTNLPEGLPAFPTEYNGEKFTNYMLCYAKRCDGEHYDVFCFFEEPACYMSVDAFSHDTYEFGTLRFVQYEVYKSHVESGTAKWCVYGNFNQSLRCVASACYYVNFPVYADSSLSEVVFPPAPAVSQTVAGLVPEQMTELTMKEVISLIPLLIGLVVLCLGFRKALRMVLQLLRAA